MPRDEAQLNFMSRVLLELPVDLNEAHCSDRVVTVDMPLPGWGETKLSYNRATRPPEVSKDAREK
jgi:hypothetical protein